MEKYNAKSVGKIVMNERRGGNLDIYEEAMKNNFSGLQNCSSHLALGVPQLLSSTTISIL
jgi:hypothetical protein